MEAPITRKLAFILKQKTGGYLQQKQFFGNDSSQKTWPEFQMIQRLGNQPKRVCKGRQNYVVRFWVFISNSETCL